MRKRREGKVRRGRVGEEEDCMRRGWEEEEYSI